MKRKKRNKSRSRQNQASNRKAMHMKNNSKTMKPGLSHCWRDEAPETVIKSVHQLGSLSFLIVALAASIATVRAGDQIVFPSSHELPSGSIQRLSRQQIYINPQPSILSGRYQTAPLIQAERRQAPSGLTSSGASYQPPILRGPLSGPRPASTAASSIGKGDESPVAEWPFFKSFQTARNNQLSNQQGQQTAPTSSSTTTPATTQDAAEPTSTEAELLDGGAPLESAATSQENPSTTSSPEGSMAHEREATTETLPVLEVDLGEMMREMQKSQMIATTTTTTTSTTTTTTAAPFVSEQTGKAKADQRTSEMLLMAPKMHGSIQRAVDRLVEMGTTKANDAGNKSEAPTVMRLNGNSQGLKSSLSLNVLLKNFGAFNLSSLDQILLKSSLNEASGDAQTNTSSKTDLGRLSINGLHRLDDRRPTTTTDSNSEGQDETSGLGEQQAAAAECKIEYTMKHVNITLMNDDKSDYTCDYIIDRKTSKPVSSKGRICKLQLRSEFFSNESSSGDGAERDGAATTCAGATHLAIGPMKFCLLEAGSARGSSLDRMFDFPIEHEAFDIKLVHRQTERRHESESLNSPGEIRLEIVPLAEETCGREQAIHPSTATATAITTTTTTTTTTTRPTTPTAKPAESSNRTVGSTPKPVISAGSSPAPERGRMRIPPSDGARRPASQDFVVRTESEGKRQEKSKLANDELDSKRAAKERTPSSQNQLPESKPMFRLTSEQQRGEMKKSSICERDSIHISTIGQIETPNYPNNYTANMRCRHVIKRVSRAHCKLLLHFRDFDLAAREAPSESLPALGNQSTGELCDGDYLQIGETRYCNKYAMLGHKMYLNFSEASTSELRDEAIALTIFSDSQASGRGLLIKYQQLSCEQPVDTSKRSRHKPESSTTKAPEQPEASGGLQTLAPPLQQPDFSLVHKGNTNWSEANNQTGGGQQLAGSSQRGPRSRPGQARGPKQARLPQATGLERAQAPKQPTTSSQASGPLQTASSSTVATGDLLLADTPTTSASTLLNDESSSSSSNCNQVHNGMQFLLRSPNYPRPYDNNLACVYYIRRNSSRVCYLELSFLSFQLEADSDCRYDSLEVNNVRLCGSLRQETTRIYLFEEAVKLIRFRTDATNPKAGFFIRAQQLECNLDGSILRHDPATPIASQPTSSSTPATSVERDKTRNSSAVFEYDSPLSQSSRQNGSPGASNSTKIGDSSSQEPLAGRSRQLIDSSSVWLQNNSNGNKLERNQTSGQENQQQSARSCDYLLHGSDITIRSPMWPEGYASDELLSSCRYTILRQNFGSGQRNSICQLELRFVHLRLGPGDCLDIDGMELFCSFNARNLIKYYPFNERQTHLTITFTTASGAAKFTGRSATPPYQHHHAQPSSARNYSDLLPSMRGPFRFMILARQLECIDDFLAPQVDLDEPTAGGANNQPLVNTTNLLYTGELPPVRPLHLRPRYVNRTSLPLPTVSSGLQPVALHSKMEANRLSYDQQAPDQATTTNLEPMRRGPPPSRAARCRAQRIHL